VHRVPELRIRDLNGAPVRPDGKYVLYWMIAARRPHWNFALDRALELAGELDRPLVVLEALRAGYPWASDRLHRFAIDGMADNARAFAKSDVLYHPYVEPRPGAGKGLVEALARDACAAVTDDFPAFFLPRMTSAVAARLPVRLETVDGNGVLPMRAAPKEFARAFDFRRFLQRELPAHLDRAPRRAPLRSAVRPLRRWPADVIRRWPAADSRLLDGDAGALARLPIDHGVPPVAYRGGTRTGRRAMGRFLEQRLDGYGETRNQPESETTSGLSPYLHYGHVSAHEVLHAVCAREGWTPADVSRRASGKRSGWWGLRPPAESFLDQLVTWRELGFNCCVHRPDYDRYASLPEWARRTLREHARDPRPHRYTLEQFDRAETHDSLWNAAQNQLRAEGRIHNYLRMLWGKKVLHWSASPRRALEILIELNNRYAVDGRDPNSYSGIFWTLGRFDRAWGPEREVFGKVRYMSSANTRRKLRVDGYVERWGDAVDPA